MSERARADADEDEDEDKDAKEWPRSVRRTYESGYEDELRR